MKEPEKEIRKTLTGTETAPVEAQRYYITGVPSTLDKESLVTFIKEHIGWNTSDAKMFGTIGGRAATVAAAGTPPNWDSEALECSLQVFNTILHISKAKSKEERKAKLDAGDTFANAKQKTDSKETDKTPTQAKFEARLISLVKGTGAATSAAVRANAAPATVAISNAPAAPAATGQKRDGRDEGDEPMQQAKKPAIELSAAAAEQRKFDEIEKTSSARSGNR